MVRNAGQNGHLKRHGRELHFLPTQDCCSFSYFCIFTSAEIHKVFGHGSVIPETVKGF